MAHNHINHSHNLLKFISILSFTNAQHNYLKEPKWREKHNIRLGK